MTRQSESSGMRDSLSINEENVGLLSDPFRDPYGERSFSEPEKTRNILGRPTIDRCRGLNNLHVSLVPDGSSDKVSVALVGCVHSTEVSRLENKIFVAFDPC